MVLVVGETVILLPIPAGVPPHEPEYHLAVAPVPALPPTSVRVVLPPLQIVETPEILRGAVERILTVMVISFEVATEVVKHAAFEVNCTFILSWSTKSLLIKVAFVSPNISILFLNHLY